MNAVFKMIKVGLGGMDTACVTPDGKHVVLLARNKFVLWSLKDGNRVCTVVERSLLTSVCVTPDSTRVVVGSRNNVARMWKVGDGEAELVCTFRGHSDAVTSVCVTPDGQYLVTGSADSTSRVWNLSTGHHVRTLRGTRSTGVTSVSLTADGKRVVTVSCVPCTTRVWKLDSGELLCVFNLGSFPTSTCLTPCGMNLLVASARSGAGSVAEARMFRLRDGALLRQSRMHSTWVTSMCVTPDGKHLVTGSFDDTGCVWNLLSGECVRTLEGHSSTVISCVTPDGKHVVTTSGDDTVRVWPLARARWARLRLLFWVSRFLWWWSTLPYRPGSRQAVAAAREFGALAKRMKIN